MENYKIKKPIRLIELFAGYGSQYLALKRIGANVESYKTSEWNIHSVRAYREIHYDKKIDYTQNMSKKEIEDALILLGISEDGKNLIKEDTIRKKKEDWLKDVYNAFKQTKNLGSLCNFNAKDLEIKNTNEFEYILTYSFPCQDISQAGTMRGMKRGGGTRSGLLWEVERLLKESVRDELELPQILFMENVPQVINSKNLSDFNEWVSFLSSLGYSCFYNLCNAKDFNIPQSRNRCFMVSILGDYTYEFPKPIPLTRHLDDFLECNVDKNFYIDDRRTKKLLDELQKNGKLEAYNNKLENNEKENKLVFVSGIGDNLWLNNGKELSRNFKQGYRVYGENGISTTITAHGGGLGGCTGLYLIKEEGRLKKNGELYLIKDEKELVDYKKTIVTYKVPQIVRVRKHKVDIEKLKSLLKEAKRKSKKTNKEIANYFNVPLTLVEHWFRYDNSFSIPNPEYWMKLKELLDIQTNEFDLSIMEFEKREGVYEKSSRVYGDNGLVPTITTIDGDIPILEKKYLPTLNENKLATFNIRRLTAIETFMLMGVSREDAIKISNIETLSQCYKLAGNSIVVDVMCHIFGKLI